MAEFIERAELRRIVNRASIGCAPSTREKLRSVAQTTDAVAVGWFHCNGVGCPARQARRPNQRFQEAFDLAMFEHFGLVDHKDDMQRFAFVVEVRDRLALDEGDRT
jgi:hypothetical protein